MFVLPSASIYSLFCWGQYHCCCYCGDAKDTHAGWEWPSARLMATMRARSLCDENYQSHSIKEFLFACSRTELRNLLHAYSPTRLSTRRFASCVKESSRAWLDFQDNLFRSLWVANYGSKLFQYLECHRQVMKINLDIVLSYLNIQDNNLYNISIQLSIQYQDCGDKNVNNLVLT